VKTFSALAETARTRRWAELDLLFEWQLFRDKFGASPSSITLRMRAAAAVSVIGQEWLPLVQNIEAIGDALDALETGGTNATLDLVLSNTTRIDTAAVSAARLADLLRVGLNGGAGTYDVQFSELLIKLLLVPGGAAGDAVTLFRLQGEEVVGLTHDQLTVHFSGVELGLEDLDDLYRISTADFPLCDPDVVGEPITPVIGSVTEVPAQGLVSGIVHKLALDITATDPPTGGALPVSDLDLLVRMPVTGTIQTDEERITYTGRDLNGLTFTGIVRGAFGDAPQPHTKGAVVFQVLSEYVLGLGCNLGALPTKGVLRVKSDGALVAPTSYTVELANTTVKPGRSLVLLRFPVKPIIKKQIQLAVEDTIIVQDTINVDDSVPLGDSIGVVDSPFINTHGAEQVAVRLPITPFPLTLALNFHTGIAESAAPFFSTGPIPMPQFPPGSGGTILVIWEIAWEFAQNSVGGPQVDQMASVRLTWNTLPSGALVTFFLRNGAPNVQSFPSHPIDTRPLFITQVVSPSAYPTHTVFTLRQWASSIGLPAGNAGTQPTIIRITSVKATVHRTLPIDRIPASKAGTVVKQRPAIKIGQAVKVGGVQLVGNTSAETVLGTITADVEGLTDDGSGTISSFVGGPGASQLLRHPAEVTYALMREVYGETTPANFHQARWQATRTAQVAQGYTWGFKWSPLRWSEFRRLAGLQGFADLFQEGGQWIYAYRAFGAPVVTFDGRNTIGPPAVSWTPRTELVTALVAPYDWDPAAQRYRASVERRSTRHAERSGIRRRQDAKTREVTDLPLPWVRDVNTAHRLATAWLEQLEQPRMRVTCAGPWESLVLEKADIIALDLTAWPHLTPFGNVGLAIRGKRYRLAQGLVEFDAVELDQLPSEVQKLAAYFLRHTATPQRGATYRLLLTKDQVKGATYRLVTAAELACLAEFRLTLEQTPEKAGEYRLQPILTTTLSAAYSIATAYDSGVLYDGTAFYDGQQDVFNAYDGGPNGILYDAEETYDL
jgi:hypothetical protein